jgi:hypothetical protein
MPTQFWRCSWLLRSVVFFAGLQAPCFAQESGGFVFRLLGGGGGETGTYLYKGTLKNGQKKTFEAEFSGYSISLAGQGGWRIAPRFTLLAELGASFQSFEQAGDLPWVDVDGSLAWRGLLVGEVRESAEPGLLVQVGAGYTANLWMGSTMEIGAIDNVVEMKGNAGPIFLLAPGYEMSRSFAVHIRTTFAPMSAPQQTYRAIQAQVLASHAFW